MNNNNNNNNNNNSNNNNNDNNNNNNNNKNNNNYSNTLIYIQNWTLSKLCQTSVETPSLKRYELQHNNKNNTVRKIYIYKTDPYQISVKTYGNNPSLKRYVL